jgi:hypothetical protein
MQTFEGAAACSLQAWLKRGDGALRRYDFAGPFEMGEAVLHRNPACRHRRLGKVEGQRQVERGSLGQPHG